MISSAVDLYLSGGDIDPFASPSYVDGTERVKQAIVILLQTGAGEFINDLDWGVPWTQWMVFKPFPITTAQTLLAAGCATEPGVRSVDSLTIVQVHNTVTITIALTLDSGESATGVGTVSGVGPIRTPWTWTTTGGWAGSAIVPR